MRYATFLQVLLVSDRGLVLQKQSKDACPTVTSSLSQQLHKVHNLGKVMLIIAAHSAIVLGSIQKSRGT
jgi:hypothetical protein